MSRTHESARASRRNSAAEYLLIGHILDQAPEQQQQSRTAESQPDARHEISRQVGRVAAMLSAKDRPYATR